MSLFFRYSAKTQVCDTSAALSSLDFATQARRPREKGMEAHVTVVSDFSWTLICDLRSHSKPALRGCCSPSRGTRIPAHAMIPVPLLAFETVSAKECHCNARSAQRGCRSPTWGTRSPVDGSRWDAFFHACCGRLQAFSTLAGGAWMGGLWMEGKRP